MHSLIRLVSIFIVTRRNIKLNDKTNDVRLHNADTVKRFMQVVRGFMSGVDIMTAHAGLDPKSFRGVYALDLSENTYVKLGSANVEELR